VTVGIDRQALNQNREGDTPQEGGQPGSSSDSSVGPSAPTWIVDLAAPFDTDDARDHSDQDGQQGQVQRREQRGVPVGERGEHCCAGGDQPDLVGIPHRADGVQCRAPALFGIRTTCPARHSEWSHQHADTEVESLEKYEAEE
jgi:hypothetical protein